MGIKIILVNATAATSGGALTILRQFLNNFPTNYKLYAFVAIDPVLLPQAINIRYININAKSWIKRIVWDNWGFENWCKKNQIIPDLIISLQNTGVKSKQSIKQLIYYHQPIPLYNYKWSFLNKSQRHLWLYKNIYLWFVKKTITDNTIFVAQFYWIKSKLEFLLKINADRVKVIEPSVDTIKIEEIQSLNLAGKLKIFYPSSIQEFKNHLEIVNAFIYLKNENILGDYIVYFTFHREDYPSLLKIIDQNSLQHHFIFLGNTEYQETLRYYKSCDLLLFPSIMETFGLPLVESALFGKKIIAANLDYAHEVLNGYEGVEFVPINNSKAWGNAIVNFADNIKNYPTWSPSFTKNSWNNFFILVADYIENK